MQSTKLAGQPFSHLLKESNDAELDFQCSSRVTANTESVLDSVVARRSRLIDAATAICASCMQECGVSNPIKDNLACREHTQLRTGLLAD